MVGFVVVGMAVALGVFIQYLASGSRAPEDIPRAIAIPAVYGTIGFLSIVGALQRRPAIVVAAGVLCLVGTALSVATIVFGVPGVVLILLGPRIRAGRRRQWLETVIAAVTIPLVVGAAMAVLSVTEERCWRATGSPSNPTYTVVPCTAQIVIGAGDHAFAGGSDSAVLTWAGGLLEAALLLGALTLTLATDQRRRSPGEQAASQRSPEVVQ